MNKRLLKVIFSVMLSSMFLVGCSKGVNFENVYNEIGSPTYARLASDNSYLVIDTNPNDIKDEYDKEAFDTIEKLNKKFGFSQSLLEKMNKTRSLDGKQNDENKNYKVAWAYHPNKGLEVMYEKK